MKFWARKAKDKHNVDIQWDGDVLNVLADGYNVHYGARYFIHTNTCSNESFLKSRYADFSGFLSRLELSPGL